MKIEYNCQNKDFKMVNEVYGILKDRKKLKEGKIDKFKTYFSSTFEYVIILIFIIFIEVILSLLLTGKVRFSDLFLFAPFLLIAMLHMLIEWCRLNSLSKIKGDGVIEINEEGFYDLYDGVGHFYSWDRIDYIFVGERSVVILTTGRVGFYYSKEYSKKIISCVKKYKKDILVLKLLNEKGELDGTEKK